MRTISRKELNGEEYTIWDSHLVWKDLVIPSNVYTIKSQQKDRYDCHMREFLIDGRDGKGFRLEIGNYEDAYGTFKLFSTIKVSDHVVSDKFVTGAMPDPSLASEIILCTDSKLAFEKAIRQIISQMINNPRAPGRQENIALIHQLQDIKDAVSHLVFDVSLPKPDLRV